MTDAGFMATLALYVWEAEKARLPYLLVDATTFKHQFGGGIMEWRDSSIIPRYGAAGVKKFAFHIPAQAPITMENGGSETVEGPAVFPTAWFGSRENAIAWLTQP